MIQFKTFDSFFDLLSELNSKGQYFKLYSSIRNSKSKFEFNDDDEKSSEFSIKYLLLTSIGDFYYSEIVSEIPLKNITLKVEPFNPEPTDISDIKVNGNIE